MKQSRIKNFLSSLFFVALLSVPLMPAQAAMIDNNVLLQQETLGHESFNQALDRNAVQTQLTAMGVDPVVASERVSQMTDAELALLNERINELPAGSGAGGIILGILLVLLITDLVGATDVFPFINPINQ
jgi:hypothetical protein